MWGQLFAPGALGVADQLLDGVALSAEMHCAAFLQRTDGLAHVEGVWQPVPRRSCSKHTQKFAALIRDADEPRIVFVFQLQPQELAYKVRAQHQPLR